VLIRHFEFAPPDNNEIEVIRGLLPRPRIKGEEGSRLPLKVKRVD
jgi:hypothetical protein